MLICEFFHDLLFNYIGDDYIKDAEEYLDTRDAFDILSDIEESIIIEERGAVEHKQEPLPNPRDLTDLFDNYGGRGLHIIAIRHPELIEFKDGEPKDLLFPQAREQEETILANFEEYAWAFLRVLIYKYLGAIIK